MLLGMVIGASGVLLGGALGAWIAHKVLVRRILSQGFWPLAPGFGDRRAEKEIAAQSLALRTVATPRPDGPTRSTRARFRGRRRM